MTAVRSAARALRGVLARSPRADLALLPTPLQALERLSSHLGGPRILVKRDDCTGLAGGGNKARKLEFLLGDALERGADTVITTGALQSNHARQTAAACAKLGLKCVLVLVAPAQIPTPAYRDSGNALMSRLLGAERVELKPGESAQSVMDQAAREVRRRGGTPYVIPRGGSCLKGDLGYVECALELAEQTLAQGERLEHVVLTTGSGGTQAGLLAGFHLLGIQPRVTGIAVSARCAEQVPRVVDLAAKTAQHLQAGASLPPEQVVVVDDYLGAHYGAPTPEMVEAVKLAARLEGLMLDPVYTGKAMAGLIGLVRQGRFKQGETVIFLHTGGLPGLFARPDLFGGGD